MDRQPTTIAAQIVAMRKEKHASDQDKLEKWTDTRIQNLAWVCAHESGDPADWATIRNRKGDFIARMPKSLAEDICRKQSLSVVYAGQIEADALRKDK